MHTSRLSTLPPKRRSLSRHRSQNIFRSPKERIIEVLLALCAMVSVVTTVSIVAILLVESLSFFGEVSLFRFLGESQWTPQFTEQHFGIWPLLAGTLIVTLIAGIVAIPIGLASAIYLSSYASSAVRKWLKPGLELLAGVPTVVYGYFALTAVTPLLQQWLPELEVYNALSAGIVVGIMIIPMVASLSEDALRVVPRLLSEGAFALGATKMEVILRVVVPAAFSGIMASFILALSRAIGETMIVTLAAGATPKLTLNPFTSIQTMTAYIVQVSLGDTPQGTVVYQSLFAVGFVLFLLTLSINQLAQRIIRRYHEQA